MPRCAGLMRWLAFAVAATAALFAQTAVSDDSLWHEFGLVQQSTATVGRAVATVYRMKDVTGAVAAWEWQRGPSSKPCTLEAFCTASGARTVIAFTNYAITFDGPVTKMEVDAFVQTLPNRHDSSLPAILTFVPRKNLVPNSARYVLGQESLRAFAPELLNVNPGFDQGAEAEVAAYKSNSGVPLKLALFYYPAPEMARLHVSQFKALPGVEAKRSGVLIAVVFGGESEQRANALLAQIGYDAKITWNETPPPSPIKPLYQLLSNIIFLSLVLVALCSVAGLIYAGIRRYRRKFGSLEDEEAMTTLHLTGE